MKKRALSLLLCLCMTATLLPTTVWAEEGSPQNGTVTLEEDKFYSNDELLELYFYSGGLDSSTLTLPTTLTEAQKTLYEKLATEVEKVATGNATSTEFDLGINYTAADLKIALDCLIMGCPQYFYWWGRSYTPNSPSVKLTVAKDYAPGEVSDGYTVDSAKIKAANDAIANAAAIVKTYESASTYGKLDGYRKEICALVDYNKEAAGQSTANMGSNPWEMVHVFDGDPDTKVVCEGYSRAFQYLCNLTTDLGAECYTVSGTMNGGTGAGGHMWNIVRIPGTTAEDGKSYLVDVTNCDDGTVGAPKKLFMVGSNTGSVTGGYSIPAGSSTITYKYYDSTSGEGHTDQFAAVGEAVLTLALENYTDPAAPTSITITCDPATDSTGSEYFLVPTLDELAKLGTDGLKTITLTADPADKAYDWFLSGTDDKEIQLSYEGNSNQAKLTISSLALEDYDPAALNGLLGPGVTVTASCGTTSKEKTLSIFARHRSAASVKIVKGSEDVGVNNTEVTISAGDSAAYAARVYDQYGVKMDGRQVTSNLDTSSKPVITNQPAQAVTWTVAPTGKGVTVNGGTVTVGQAAEAGKYTVTASVDGSTVSASMTVNVVAQHSHSWDITKWEQDETHHWHECTAADCPVTDNSQKEGYAEHAWTLSADKTKYTCVCGKEKVHDHDFSGVLQHDSTGHWHVCQDTACGTAETKTEHKWDEGKETTAPTCTEKGVKTFTCECGETKTEELATIPHTYGATYEKDNTQHWQVCTVCKQAGEKADHTWNVTFSKDPTCTEAGRKDYECTVCKQTKTDTTPALEHKWSATLESDGEYHWTKCDNCTEIKDKAAHAWDEGKVSKEATYEADGEMTYTCAICQKTVTTPIPKLTHKFSAVWSHDADQHWHQCTCEAGTGHTLQKQDAANHTFDAGVETSPATYESAGVKAFTCTVCGYSKTETIPQLTHTFDETAWEKDNDYHWHACTIEGHTDQSGKAPHTWDGGTVTTQATDTEDGVKTYTCTVCQQTRTETIGKTGHTFATEWTTSETEHWHACTDTHGGGADPCAEVSEKAAHTWDAGTVKTAATHTDAGVMTYTCTVCGKTREAEIPAHTVSTSWSSDGNNHWHACTEPGCDQTADKAAHAWVEGTPDPAPTYDAIGLRIDTCICGASRKVTLPQLTHNFNTSTWMKDETNHWHACGDEGCDAKSELAAHTWNAGTITKAPTEVDTGVKTYTCTVCQQTRTEEIAALGHSHSWATEWSKDESGHWHACKSSTCTVKDSFAAHTPGDWIIDTAATATTAGSRHKECTVCQYHTETETIPATGGSVPAISGISYNYSTGALSWTGRNIPETKPGQYFWITICRADGTEVDNSGKECMETDVHESGIRVTKSGDTYSCTYKPVPLADGNYKIVIECRVPDGSTFEHSFTVSTSSGGGGSSGGGSSSSSGTTTKNPDGSTTTTSTKSDGTKVETTKNTDGSQTTVETKKDGTVTTTETDKTGNKTETVANPDGSSQTRVEQKDGTTATMTTDVEGKTEAKVELSEKAVSEAQKEDKPVALPIPELKSSSSAETAPVVTVTTGSKDAVKVEIPVEDTKPGTVAVIVKEDGTEEIIKTTIPTEKGVAVELPDGATVKIVDNSKSFEDVPSTSWAADAVAFSSARELFAGTSETTFSPEASMTRAMLVTVLARFDGVDTSGGDTWYQKGVDWAVSSGISDGGAPDSNITREQLVAMLWRYAGSPTPSKALDDFTDAGAVSGYAQDAMRWAVENGIISGMGDNTLAPQGNATRAQVASILQRFVTK